MEVQRFVPRLAIVLIISRMVILMSERKFTYEANKIIV